MRIPQRPPSSVTEYMTECKKTLQLVCSSTVPPIKHHEEPFHQLRRNRLFYTLREKRNVFHEGVGCYVGISQIENMLSELDHKDGRWLSIVMRRFPCVATALFFHSSEVLVDENPSQNFLCGLLALQMVNFFHVIALHRWNKVSVRRTLHSALFTTMAKFGRICRFCRGQTQFQGRAWQ